MTATQWRVWINYVLKELNLNILSANVLTLSDPGPGQAANKGQVVFNSLQAQGYTAVQGLFVDDSAKNIASASGIANTLYLPQRAGLTDTDRSYVETLSLAQLPLGKVNCQRYNGEEAETDGLSDGQTTGIIMGVIGALILLITCAANLCRSNK